MGDFVKFGDEWVGDLEAIDSIVRRWAFAQALKLNSVAEPATGFKWIPGTYTPRKVVVDHKSLRTMRDRFTDAARNEIQLLLCGGRFGEAFAKLADWRAEGEAIWRNYQKEIGLVQADERANLAHLEQWIFWSRFARDASFSSLEILALALPGGQFAAAVFIIAGLRGGANLYDTGSFVSAAAEAAGTTATMTFNRLALGAATRGQGVAIASCGIMIDTSMETVKLAASNPRAKSEDIALGAAAHLSWGLVDLAAGTIVPGDPHPTVTDPQPLLKFLRPSDTFASNAARMGRVTKHVVHAGMDATQGYAKPIFGAGIETGKSLFAAPREPGPRRAPAKRLTVLPPMAMRSLDLARRFNTRPKRASEKDVAFVIVNALRPGEISDGPKLFAGGH